MTLGIMRGTEEEAKNDLQQFLLLEVLDEVII